MHGPGYRKAPRTLVEVLLVVTPLRLPQAPEKREVVRQLDRPVRLGLSIRSKLSWCGAVCQAPKWRLPRSGGSGIPCFSPQCMHSRSAAKVGGCVYRHLESWTPADAAASPRTLDARPSGLGSTSRGGEGSWFIPIGFVEVVESLSVIWCNAEERCQTLSTGERSRRLSDEASGQGARRARLRRTRSAYTHPPTLCGLPYRCLSTLVRICQTRWPAGGVGAWWGCRVACTRASREF